MLACVKRDTLTMLAWRRRHTLNASLMNMPSLSSARERAKASSLSFSPVAYRRFSSMLIWPGMMSFLDINMPDEPTLTW